MRMSEQDYADLLMRRSAVRTSHVAAPKVKQAGSTPRGQMNKLEARYCAEVLDLRLLAKEIAGYWYEPIKFRLANGAWYCPDFMVLMPSGKCQMHEVKGFWRTAARVRIKVAADKYPFTFISAQRVKGEWVFETFG